MRAGRLDAAAAEFREALAAEPGPGKEGLVKELKELKEITAMLESEQNGGAPFADAEGPR